ncbi:MAG: hypothetical protein L3K25_07700 [Gammaproteobacteria bacterium]|nr:hypothetical protein [Gammaproteobacteria bacterium]
MPRPKYTISKTDISNARRYLQNAMKRGDISDVDGYMRFCHAGTPEQLQSWCDDYLPAPIFKKLKTAVLAARKRDRDYRTTKAKVGIDLDHYAHMRLLSLGKELNLTLSETVVRMEEAYWQARDAGLAK